MQTITEAMKSNKKETQEAVVVMKSEKIKKNMKNISLQVQEDFGQSSSL